MDNTLKALIPTRPLVKAIEFIEKSFPGYWWSISQRYQSITVSMAPSPYCLLDVDRAFANTKEGDTGFTSTTTYTDEFPDDLDLVKGLLPLVDFIEKKRKELVDTLTEFPEYVGPHRRQYPEDFKKLKKEYETLIKTITLPSTDSYDLREVYIGSCQLSVDVSLRGVDGSGAEFDITYDLKDDAILADSLSQAIDNFIEDFDIKIP